MKRVNQRLNRDCFFCCLGMATGLTYEQMGKRMGWELMAQMAQDGSSHELHAKMAEKVGLRQNENMKRVWCAPGYTGLRVIRELLWERRAIIQVPISSGDSHAIYWDGKQLHDPQAIEKYRWDWSNIGTISNVWLLLNEEVPATA